MKLIVEEKHKSCTPTKNLSFYGTVGCANPEIFDKGLFAQE